MKIKNTQNGNQILVIYNNIRYIVNHMRINLLYMFMIIKKINFKFIFEIHILIIWLKN